MESSIDELGPSRDKIISDNLINSNKLPEKIPKYEKQFSHNSRMTRDTLTENEKNQLRHRLYLVKNSILDSC
jgi:hypothetical protein